MQPSMFNVRVPLADAGGGDDVFLMNTFTDAQLIVSREVAGLLDRVAAGGAAAVRTAEERDALSTLSEHGFVVEDRAGERRKLEDFFRDFREDGDQVRVTVLTTLQCNFACEYCFQGDHGNYNKYAAKMTMETALEVAEWIDARLDRVKPESFALTFFGGEPLLNLPVVYFLAERMWNACELRGIRMLVNVITNGLLLTPDVVDRLQPFGLNGVKVTLDGDRETHDRMRPLRGGQGTFDRIIANVRQVASKTRVTIGGNFDMSSTASYPALLDFLEEQEFADKLARVAFKPVIRDAQAAPPSAAGSRKFLALTDVSGTGTALSARCGGGTSICDGCDFADEQMAFLREETKKRGFETSDGLHMGPCEIHRRHAYTIGPEGSLYACPGFSGDASRSTGHIDGRRDRRRAEAAARFEALAAWKACGDCAFLPVCAGGCSVASHAELGDMDRPSCHKSSLEAALVSLAREAAAAGVVVT